MVGLPVTPATLLRWHRELGATSMDLRSLSPVSSGLDPPLVELSCGWHARNSRWVTCGSVGVRQSWERRFRPTPWRNILRRNGLGLPRGAAGPSWASSFAPRPPGVLACDFFTVETSGLPLMYFLFSSFSSSFAWCWLGGVSPHPTGGGCPQVRNLTTALGESDRPDQVPRCASDANMWALRHRVQAPAYGCETPVRAPRANAVGGALGSAAFRPDAWTGS